ncbi:hypothetical protein D3C73_847690 [compost metagenome]
MEKIRDKPMVNNQSLVSLFTAYSSAQQTLSIIVAPQVALLKTKSLIPKYQ